MKTLIVIMTLMGCNDDGNQCEIMRTMPQQFTSIESCHQAAGKQISGMTASDFPVTMAQCTLRANTKTTQLAAISPAPVKPAPLPVITATEKPATGFSPAIVPGYSTLVSSATISALWIGKTSVNLAHSTSNAVTDTLQFGYGLIGATAKTQ